MTETAATAQPPSGAVQVARVWALHLLCFVLPVTCIVFGLSAPHPWWASLPFAGVIFGSIWLDMRSPSEFRQPAEAMPAWPFDAMLYLAVALQLLSVGLLLRMVALNGFWRMDTLVGLFLVGVNSGYSGIVVAHELIHRKEERFQNLGRLLLAAVLYEHFAIEHVRGHHSRIGTPEDPATARMGESSRAFLLRTVPAQLRSAWRLEKKRLGDEHMSWNDRRMLGNRMVHGLVAEWGFALGILVVLGPGAFAAYLLQAAFAVRLLEAVNWFEHYGLVRKSRRVRTVDSWDTDSWFTLYTLVGLSRHADHHAHASRPFPLLRRYDESPKLRYGYLGSVAWAIWDDATFRIVMERELKRRHLGAFAEESTSVGDAMAEVQPVAG